MDLNTPELIYSDSMAFNIFGKKKPAKHRKIKHIVAKSARTHATKKIAKPAQKKSKTMERVRVEKVEDEKAYEIARKFKIPVIDTFFVKRQDELEKALKKAGYPCVMKVSGDVIHKTEVGGVITNITDHSRALEAFNRLMKIRGTNKIIVQRQLHGTELIIGSKKDSQFGYVIVAGLGGIFVEMLKDVSFRVCPISIQDAEDMIKELKGYEILKGVRGEKPINFPSLYETLIKISRLALSEKIKELDINPLFCNEHGCFAADIRIVK
jgi:acetyl-CoA synthetase (ADP-forming)